MAKNTNNRIPVKWIRDKAKAAYQKQDHCYVCGKSEDLELHHLHSITVLLNRWSEQKGYDISTDDGILAVRDEFIAEHEYEVFEATVTLCHFHHADSLHKIYGKSPGFNPQKYLSVISNPEPDSPLWQLNRIDIKVGRFIKRFLGDSFTDSEVEDFVNKWKYEMYK